MTILNVLLEITVYSAILFAVTLLFKKLLKGKLSPALHLAVWMLLIIRLMLPVTFDTAVHFISLPSETIQIDTREETSLPIETTEKLQTMPVENVRPTTAESDESVSVQSNGQASAHTTVSQPIRFDWQSALIAVWAAGMAVCSGMAVCGYSRIRRKLRHDAMQPPEALEALFDECRSELKISGRIKLRVQRFTQSPALLFPSNVLVPVSMLDMEHEKVKLALMHELMHYKRKDQLFAMLLLVLRIVYWFNPVVHLAERIIRDDIETACDSSVAKRLSPDEKGVYARSLIAMYNSAPETQMVLGMALGGTRKGAEKRIRGIYSKQKSPWRVKITAVLLAGIMFVCCFTTACQPTPETPPVVHKVEDIPKEAIQETVTTPIAEVKNTVEQAAYSVKEHWAETVKKNDFFSIEVDADILLPEAASYPIERLERVVLTQEKVNELIAFFTEPGTKFYTGEYVKLKSEYEEELIDLKKSLQDVLNGGDGETPESIRGYIKEVESKLAKAPETHTYTYVEPIFTYETDYETGEPRRDYGEDTISVSIENPDGSRYGSVYATRYQKGKIDRSSFSYSRFSGGCDMESYFTWYDEELKREMENRPPGADKDGGLWDKDMASQREFVDAGLENMKKNNMDLRAAADKAVHLLEELGKEGMQLKSYEKAMFSKESGNEDNTIPGCYVEFVRECGGIPSLSQRGGSFSSEQDYSELYCAPFDLEGVTVLISEEGVESFSWRNMAKVVERVSQDTTLMPLDEIKKRILDHVYFMNAAWLDRAPQEAKRVNITDIRLVTTYINVKDDPERVLIVPAWHIMVQEEYMFDQTDDWTLGNKEEYMINAIDGSGILMPGILEDLQKRGE